MQRIAIILFFSAVVPLNAASIVFSNLVQPGNQYGPDPIGIGHTPAFLNPGEFLQYAVPFTSGASYRLTTIQAPFAVVSGVNQIDAFLANDIGGVPGAPLELFHLTNLSGAGPAPLLNIQSVLNPTLTAGTRYWFVATGGPQTFAVWTLNLFQGDPTDGGATMVVLQNSIIPWTVGHGGRTGALQIFGDPVPEPSQFGLVTGALALIAIVRRRL